MAKSFVVRVNLSTRFSWKKVRGVLRHVSDRLDMPRPSVGLDIHDEDGAVIGHFGFEEDKPKLPSPLDYLHAQVSYQDDGMLTPIVGDVWAVTYDGHETRLKVRFFNREPWPFEPLAEKVTVLK